MVKVEKKEPDKKTSLVKAEADELALFGGRAGEITGFEALRKADLLIPRLTVLQKLSPQLERGTAEYIRDAEVGDFCDVGTGQTWKQLSILACYFATVFIEWKPNRGGIVQNHGTDASIVEKCTPNKKRQLFLPNGNYLAETMTYFVLNVTAGLRRSFIPLSATQLKNARRWNMKLDSERVTNRSGEEFRPAIYYRLWDCSIHDEKNEQGGWKGWTFQPGPRLVEMDGWKDILAEAKDFAKQAHSGQVLGDLSAEAEEDAARQDDDIPI